MNRYIPFLLLLLITNFAAVAQNTQQKEKMTREEKDEKTAARQARIDAKNDYFQFRKQIQALAEFAEEKRKLLKLQENKKVPVRIVIAIDSLDEGDTSKTLTGYIVRNTGDDASLRYDITYDRTQRKIVSVKKTQEAIETDKEVQEAKEEMAEEKAVQKKSAAKPPVSKKKSDDDDEDDEPEEEKPTKSKDED